MPSVADLLLPRRAPDGGFGGLPGEPARADATAWAVLALERSGAAATAVAAGRDQLVAHQAADGGVTPYPGVEGAIWPTALAVLAWTGSPRHAEPRRHALVRLLTTSGRTAPREPIFGHDPSIPGWPWTAGAHPWVEPTALGLAALRASGFADHARAGEAQRLLLDRQLPGGGWNYGNTTVFGHLLPPMPESSGPPLMALAGRVEERQVAASLERAAAGAGSRAPRALAWTVLGLAAWGRGAAALRDRLGRLLAAAPPRPPYDTAELALALLALAAPTGLLAGLEGTR